MDPVGVFVVATSAATAVLLLAMGSLGTGAVMCALAVVAYQWLKRSKTR